MCVRACVVFVCVRVRVRVRVRAFVCVCLCVFWLFKNVILSYLEYEKFNCLGIL